MSPGTSTQLGPSRPWLVSTAKSGAVLVVDDVEANLTAMEALLSELGCEIVLARSGNEALLYLLKRSFAVVLLDVQMPEMDGYEVARYARENPATREVPIVFLTAGSLASTGPGVIGKGGADAEESVLRAYGSGAVDFLIKPVNPSILRSKVRVFLELFARRSQILDAQTALEVANRELVETVAAKAALANQFQAANQELEQAYGNLKAAQAGLIQAAKMASLGELVAGIAHEINNPLAFCLSHLDTAQRCLNTVEQRSEPQFLDGGARQQWERARTRLHEMHAGLARINDLVLRLRAFSRLDEGGRQRLNVKECTDSVLTILHHRMEGRIKMTVRLEEPGTIECHPGLFSQALMNLVSNAIDAIDGEGAITIEAGGVGDLFRVAVADTGSGIRPELRERIFEPFFTTKPVGKGTGLGLSIAYSIVEKHGGRLEIENVESGGTRILMDVPLQAIS